MLLVFTLSHSVFANRFVSMCQGYTQPIAPLQFAQVVLARFLIILGRHKRGRAQLVGRPVLP